MEAKKLGYLRTSPTGWQLLSHFQSPSAPISCPPVHQLSFIPWYLLNKKYFIFDILYLCFQKLKIHLNEIHLLRKKKKIFNRIILYLTVKESLTSEERISISLAPVCPCWQALAASNQVRGWEWLKYKHPMTTRLPSIQPFGQFENSETKQYYKYIFHRDHDMYSAI